MKRDSRRASGSLELLEACDPVVRSALASEGIEAALDEIGAAITSRPGPAPRATRRRSSGRRRTVLVVAAGMLAISAAVATAAVMRGAHTGLFPTKPEVAMGGPGEELNPAAHDFRAVALQVASDIPYPVGYGSWRDFLISEEFRFATDGELVSTGALHGWFAASAFCAWVQSWRRRPFAGDVNATARAAQTIAQAPRWKAVTDEDPHPDPSAANDPGAEAGTLFGWMLPYRDAVLAGDRARVEHLLASGYGGGKCWSSDPDWMAQERAHREWRSLPQKELAQKYEQFLASGGS
ncbi:MAG TPA: hypothetical protein VK488_13120 [Gaiellaceae bacterium]|nr:hypothetical protein [Gaiellaceae bacterium]